MYNACNIDNNAGYLLKLKLKSVYLGDYRKRFKKIKNEKEFSSLVYSGRSYRSLHEIRKRHRKRH